MTFDPFHDSGPFLNATAELATLPGILRELGYRPEILSKVGLLRQQGMPGLPAFELRRRCMGGGRLELLCRLFALALAEDRGEVDAALQPLGVKPLLDCGLLRVEGEMVRAQAALAPVGELIVARDFSPAMTGIPARDDHVLPVGGSSMLTINLTVRGKNETVLDLGCGQGVQMLLAGEHAARVVGTDISPRALNFAAFNVALNGSEKGNAEYEYRQGSFFEPVEDLRGKFDLIISNPPFVITPSKGVVGFSSSLQGDGAVETLFRESPAFLAEDGWFISLANWHHSSEEDWAERPMEWIRDTGCDALVVQLESYHPRDYALKWIESVNFGGAPTERQMEDWMEMFDALGARAITFGFVVLHKRNGRNWLQKETLVYNFLTGEAGEQLRNVFAGRTKLQELDEAGVSVLDCPLRLLPGLRMTQQSELSGDGWTAPVITLSTAPGIQWPFTAGQVVLLLLDECDGMRTPREILLELADRHGLGVEELLDHGVEVVRTLLERGMVAAI